MTEYLTPRDVATDLAREALRSVGYTAAEPGEHHVGTLNRVICYPQAGLAVRITPPGFSRAAYRGYDVARRAGPTIAIAPISVTTHRQYTIAVLPLAQPQPTTAQSWLSAQALASRLHRVSPDRLSLTPIDHFVHVTERLEIVGESDHEAWAAPLRVVAGELAADIAAFPATSPVIVHGDLHGGQVVTLDGVDVLGDFDRAALGDPEEDVSRLAAWVNAGRIPSAVLREVLDTNPHLRVDRIEVYSRTYALRYLLFLAISQPTSPPSPTMLDFAVSLGLPA